MDAYCTRCHDRAGAMEGGVDLTSYEAVYAARVKNTCVSVGDDVVAAYAEWLLPLAGQTDAPACSTFDVFSMPLGAQPHLTLAEQVTLARWVARGGAP